MSKSKPPLSVEDQADEPFQIIFDSEGFRVEGWFFPAKGSGPFPTAILMHGFPVEGESPLDLGPALMKSGINALAFNYRGTGGSEGIYLPVTSIADVHSALLYLKSKVIAKRFAVDMTRIALVGFSYGGGIALMSALVERQVQKVCSIAGAYLCRIARQTVQDDRYKEFFLNFLQEETTTSGTRSPGAEACISQLLERFNEYDPVKNVKALVNKDILILGGWRDPYSTLEDHILPVFRALQSNGAEKLHIELLDADHSFKTVRDDLYIRIITWIKGLA
jgi:cephalosporin-C deacetylase-like acetyl esterase